MARPKKVREVRNKSVEKAMETSSPKGVKRRLVRTDKVPSFKEAGWKEAGDPKDAKGKVDGVRVNASDLVLMEKKEK